MRKYPLATSIRSADHFDRSSMAGPSFVDCVVPLTVLIVRATEDHCFEEDRKPMPQAVIPAEKHGRNVDPLNVIIRDLSIRFLVPGTPLEKIGLGPERAVWIHDVVHHGANPFAT
jgi:hypothetical protein